MGREGNDEGPTRDVSCQPEQALEPSSFVTDPDAAKCDEVEASTSEDSANKTLSESPMTTARSVKKRPFIPIKSKSGKKQKTFLVKHGM